MTPQERRAALAAVPWGWLRHVLGPADDVPAHLLAVAEGSDAARAAAWEQLWRTVHHQGTVGAATVPAVPFLADVAAAAGHPDRVEALVLLHELAEGDGAAAPDVRAAVRPHAERLVAGWRAEPEAVRRALLLLTSAYPDLAARHEELAALLPAELRAGGTGLGDEDDDREHALLDRVLAATAPPPG